MKIVVSACLMGESCKYNGLDNYHRELVEACERTGTEVLLVCPEVFGGLPTPREPSERRADAVVSRSGTDVTAQFRRGAEQALHLARLYGCKAAVLKERSPSCGSGEVYDGTFSGRLTPGDGVTAALLKANGIAVYGESDLDALLAQPEPPVEEDAQRSLF